MRNIKPHSPFSDLIFVLISVLSPLGANFGSSVAEIKFTSIFAKIVKIPGIMPAINSFPIERSVIIP